jgi:hypothetical protein
MMRLLAYFIDKAEGALHAGVTPDRIAAMACLRPLQRMGEEIAETELDKFAALEARMVAEFRTLAPAKEEESASESDR